MSKFSTTLPKTKNRQHLPKVRLKVSKKRILGIMSLATISAIVFSGFWFHNRYETATEMPIKIRELSKTEYPANPAQLSSNFQRYANRQLKVIQRDETHFDFVLKPTNNKTAEIIIENVDLSLLVPSSPRSVSQNRDLEKIALSEREWNRQQVSFPIDSKQIKIIGGDGFEKQNLYEVAIANNCLGAGLWEILLFTKEDDNKSLYYQGWFDFPLGHYKNVFEKNNRTSYWKHWLHLEHYLSPKNLGINLNLLRKVIDEKELNVSFSPDEKIIVGGEQSRKVRTTLATNLTTWGDFFDGRHDIKFASFRPPGFYDHNKPHGSQYGRIGKFEKGILRNIQPINSEISNTKEPKQEIELIFSDTKTGEQNKLLIGGIDLKKLPKLAVKDYAKGFYMPMGIGVPPFYQSYEDLSKNNPAESSYFSMLLSKENKWIDHHDLGVDGQVLHLDRDNPHLLHLYLLSYERNTLIAHYAIDLSSFN
jgi:hypothetical protein